MFEIISNSIDEAREGYGKRIIITLHEDKSITVEDFGRGIPIDFNKSEDKYNWELAFCTLYAGSKYNNNSGGNYSFALGLNGLGLCATQFSSEYMEVESRRGQWNYSLRFEKGFNVTQDERGFKKSRGDGTTGTKIHWKPDLEVFTDIDIGADYLADILRRQAVVNDGVELVLKNEHEDGTFILRIEDTDQGRYVEGAVDVIYNTLRETGLLWDEGPDIGGPVGPYVQSERMGMFKQYAEQLVAEGKAYYCFCTEERLEALHAEQRAHGEMTHYDGCCRDLPKEEVEKRLAAGEPYVIRQKIPREGVTGFDDMVYGHIEVNNSEMDDQILIKTDGMPTYNFANVVDDHLMGITHVIRGSEYLSSTPKYNLLYQAFGWNIPNYIHCPPVMKDAQNKLSKRNGDASYQDLVAKGYLTEAILNYICLLGWSPKGEYAEQEIFSLADLVKIWTPDGISKSPAIFDPLKLRAINAEYIRRLSPEEFLAKAEPWIDSAVHTPINKKLLCANLQPRCEVLGEIPEQLDFFDAMPEYDVSLYANKKQKTTPESAKEALEALLPVLSDEALDFNDRDTVFDACKAKAEELGKKNGWLLYPLGIALSGKQRTPGGGTDLACMMGRETTLERVKAAIEKLNG